MKVLIIGGTRFVGRAITETLTSNNHKVTLFNRGTSNPEVFSDLEKLVGDRDGDLSELSGREWDVVIDTCGYVPRVVQKSVEALAGRVGQYVFVSTLSVFKEKSGALTEDSELETLDDPTVEEVTGKTYGGLKVLCESEVRKVFPDSSLIVRPGVIVGANDPTDRFTYWVERSARGGDILVPEPTDRKLEFIDARDLAEFTVRMIESKNNGIYNTVDSSDNLTLERILNIAGKAFETQISLHWADFEFLKKQEIKLWWEFPLCPPADYPLAEWTDCSAARSVGLTFRPLDAILKDILAWSKTRGEDYQLKAGLSVEKETSALEALDALAGE